MQEVQKKSENTSYNDEINLLELVNILWVKKWFLFRVTAFVSICGLIYSLFLPNIYESRALLSPTKSSTSISKSLMNYSGIANLAGIRLPSQPEEGNTTKAIEKMRSLSFFENSILPNILLQDLMALKSWNYETNSIDYDKNIYDASSKVWVRDYKYPKKQIPSAQESFMVFIEDVFNIYEDKDTGFFTISIKHQSPDISKQWVELIIKEINDFYRKNDKLESIRAIDYLNQRIEMTNIAEIKESIVNLLQEETKKLALIEANEFYVFEYIDPPAVMEEKSEPSRAIICILFAIIGGVFGVIYILFNHYFINKD